jgi:hypothetical protein
MSIYKIECKDKTITELYIGKTKNKISRWRCHKHYSKEGSRLCYLRIYDFINRNGGIDNWEMIILEDFEWTDSLAKQKEREWYERLDHSLNDKYPNRTHYETTYAYSQTQKSKEQRHEKKVEKITCECGMIVSRGSMSEHLKRGRHLKRISIHQ